MTLEALAEPLIQEAREAVPEACDTHALVMDDWSRLYYGRHIRKTDRRRLGQGTAHGYELRSTLLVRVKGGQNVRADGGLSRRRRTGLRLRDRTLRDNRPATRGRDRRRAGPLVPAGQRARHRGRRPLALWHRWRWRIESFF